MLILKILNNKVLAREKSYFHCFPYPKLILNKISLQTSISPQVPEAMKSDITAPRVPHIFSALPCDWIGVETLITSYLGILSYESRFKSASSTLHNARGGSQNSNLSSLEIQSELFPIIFTYNEISCGFILQSVFDSKIQQSKCFTKLDNSVRKLNRGTGRETEHLKAGRNGVIPNQSLRYVCLETREALSDSYRWKWENVSCSSSITMVSLHAPPLPQDTSFSFVEQIFSFGINEQISLMSNNFITCPSQHVQFYKNSRRGQWI